MKKQFVYILKLSNGDFYKGCTENVEERMNTHLNGEVNSTKDFLPAELIWFCGFTKKEKAFSFEKYLKSGSGRAFMNKHLV